VDWLHRHARFLTQSREGMEHPSGSIRAATDYAIVREHALRWNDKNATGPYYHTYRHGCLLCGDRTAGSPGIARSSSDHRWVSRSARRRCKLFLRSQAVRDSLRYAFQDGLQVVPPSGFSPGAFRGLSRHLRSHHADLPYLHRPGGAAVQAFGE